MFNSLLNLFGLASIARTSVLDDTDFTYRVKNFSISDNEETKIEETFVKSVINPVENYEGLSVETIVKTPQEISPVNQTITEQISRELSPINTPVKEQVQEETNHVHSGQDYEHYLKATQVDLASYSDEESEEESEDKSTETEIVNNRCKQCCNYHDDVSESEEEEEKEYRSDYLYAIMIDKKVIGYINDHRQLLEYLTIIKKRIRNSYQYDGTFKYWMRYFWNETVQFDWNNDLVAKYSLVSMNTHNLLSYDRLESILSVYRMKNLLIK